jgi:hypothetical protein
MEDGAAGADGGGGNGGGGEGSSFVIGLIENRAKEVRHTLKTPLRISKTPSAFPRLLDQNPLELSWFLLRSLFRSTSPSPERFVLPGTGWDEPTCAACLDKLQLVRVGFFSSSCLFGFGSSVAFNSCASTSRVCGFSDWHLVLSVCAFHHWVTDPAVWESRIGLTQM